MLKKRPTKQAGYSICSLKTYSPTKVSDQIIAVLKSSASGGKVFIPWLLLDPLLIFCENYNKDRTTAARKSYMLSKFGWPGL
jgi:hypothetical protein